MRLLWVIITLIVFLPRLTLAQEVDSTRWYYVYNTDTGELAALNTAGEMNIIMQAGVSNNFHKATRIDAETILVTLTANDTVAHYRLSPDQAELVQEGENLYFDPVATTDGAALMVGDITGEPIPALLFTPDGMFELPQLIDGLRAYVRFSKDGQFLRYSGVDSDGQWGLWEYRVASGETRLIYSFGDIHPIVRPDIGGETWLWRAENDGQAQYTRIHADGTVEDLGTFDESLMQGSFYPIANALIAYPAACDPTCEIEIRSAEGTRLVQGNPAVFRALPLNFTADGNLLVISTEDEFFLLRPDTPPQSLGFFYENPSAGSVPFPVRFLSSSPDGRWLGAAEKADDPVQYNLIDLLTGETVRTYNIYNPALSNVMFGEAMLLLTVQDRTGSQTVDTLFYESGEAEFITYTSAELGAGVYLEVLPDQQALFDGRESIYIHDLRTGQKTTLLEGNWRVIPFYTLDTR